MKLLKKILKKYTESGLIIRIIIGIIIGATLGILVPQAQWISILGTIFVGALKAIAPVLVAVLVIGSLCQKSAKLDRRFGRVIFFYTLSTFLASVVSVLASFAFPQTIILNAEPSDIAQSSPEDISEILENMLKSIFDNPIAALSESNYLGILFWAIVIGLALKKIAGTTTQEVMMNLSDAISHVVGRIIDLAPFGIFGLVYNAISEGGIHAFASYGKLELLLICTMLFVALVINPFIVAVALKKNPYPLVFRCIKESGVTAFFTRSSAANIPINLSLCKKLGLDRNMYSVSIPLGATINMDGAAVTITIMTLAAAHTFGIVVSLPSALILAFLSTLAACGSSGVTGGSLLLIPMACSLFGIPDSVSMQVVGVGGLRGVVQDSMETALNSSGDVLFTATAEYVQWIKEGKTLPDFSQKHKCSKTS